MENRYIENREVDVLVTVDTAVLAKAVNFNWPCRHLYKNNGDLDELNYYEGDAAGRCTNDGISSGEDYVVDGALCAAPTKASLQKWIREKYGIHIYFEYDLNDESEIIIEISVIDVTGELKYVDEVFTSPEEALEKGLYESLNIINNKENY